MFIDIELIDHYVLWQNKILKAKDNGFDFIFVGLYHTIRNNTGDYVKAEDVLTWTSKNTQLPIFCFWQMSVGEGKALGGLVLSGEDQGREAAQIIKAILAGKNINKIRPKTAEKGRFIFSRSEVEKWQLTIPESIAKLTTWVK